MRTNDYEAMFLLENNAATEDFDAASGQVDAILEKHGAKIVEKEKWDERKLAYEIKGQRRATYYLVYFTAPSATIEKVNEDVRLTELILRHLVIRLEEPIQEHIENRAKEREALAEDSRKNSLSGWGDRKRGGKRREDSRSLRRADGDDDGEGGDSRDAPKADAPKADTPKVDAPKADGPTADAAATEATPEPAAKAESADS